MITKKIRLIELFGGVGCQSIALKDLAIANGLNPDDVYEHYRLVEFDKFPVKSYNAIHGTDFVPMDIQDIHGKDIDVEEPDKYTAIWTYSFPCVPAGTLVKTLDGYKKIEDIVVGDKVLTHNNRYRKVLKTMSRKSDHINHIKANGCNDLFVTDEHPIYCLSNNKIQWVKAKNVTTSDYICFNVNTNSIASKCSDNILWLIGRYVADGHINKYTSNSVNFAIALKKVDEFEKHIPEDLQDKFKKFEKPGIIDFRIADEDFWELCYEFGTGSNKKELPEWILNMPSDQCRIFLDGYFSGDGHYRTVGNCEQMMFTTSSHKLFLGLQTLITKVYGLVPSAYHRTDSRSKNFSDTWQGQFYFNQTKTTQIKENNQIFTKIKSVEKIINPIDVYNIEVEEDNSYTVNNVIVHNCQDLSVAGKQLGMDEDSGTRSSLLWQVKRLLNEVPNLPDILIMENVVQVYSKKNLKNWENWVSFLESKGYHNYWQDLEASEYGVPQHRNRCFMVSILEDINYEFPRPIPLHEVMKDRLDPVVDEKFYINNEKADALIQQLIADGKLDEETILEAVDLSVNKPNTIDIANCVSARTDCGISNRRSEGSGVVQC